MIDSKSSRAQGKETGKERTRLCGAVRCGAVRCGALRCVAVRCGALRCVAHTHTRAHARSPRISNAEFKGRRKEASVRCGAHTHTNARSLT